MTPQEAADKLNNCQYREEGSPKLFADMKFAGLVCVFGASDDLMEFRGAVYDEVGVWNGGEAYFTKLGLLENECEESDCPYHAREREKACAVEAIWAENNISWQYKTDIPHVTFVVKEDDDVYCRGIIFALADVPEAA